MTRRERMERRLERRTEWAASRDASARSNFDRAHSMGDAIPFGQPILVGHHSERRDRNYRSRIDATVSRGAADARMAEHHTSKAQGIASQLARSVFSDDTDAVERLRERIADGEAKRARIKAYNVSVRKGQRDTSLLTTGEAERLADCIRFGQSSNGEFPAYHLSNLGATIRKDRQRLADIEGSRRERGE